MPGPNSCPNGDTTIMRGHVNEVFWCNSHKDALDKCDESCKMVSKRDYLQRRGQLRTGKT